MSLNACLRRIRQTASDLGVAPINVAETQLLSIVRFNTIDGSVLLTCDGESLLVTESPRRG